MERLIALNSANRRPGAVQIDQREEVLSVGPFVQLRAQLASRWMLTAGARYDRYRFKADDHFTSDGDQSGGRTLNAVSPMIGVTFAATPEVNLYSSFATSHQTPTTVELSNRPTGGGGFNDELEPEHLRTFEFGTRGVLDEWSRDIIAGELRDRGVELEVARFHEVEVIDVATPSERNATALARLLPFLLVVLLLSAGSFAAIDLVAGEKERGTLETLAVQAVTRGQIVAGKFGAIVPTGSADELASAAMTLLETDSAEMRQERHDRVRNQFSQDAMVRRTASILDEVLSRRAAQGRRRS